jgi:hypothetical protein
VSSVKSTKGSSISLRLSISIYLATNKESSFFSLGIVDSLKLFELNEIASTFIS